MNQSSPICSPAADAAFGPVVHGCRQGFDFTLAFEQYFLSIVPSALLLFATPWRLWSLTQKRRRIGGNNFKWLKLAFLCSFAMIQLTLVILWSVRPHTRAHTPSVVAASLSFAVSLALCSLSPLEHSHSLRPSMLLNVYLLISLVFDIVILRTMWLTPFDDAVRNVFTTSFALKAVLLVQEAWEKRRYLEPADRDQSPEATSSLYSQGFFWWLNGLIWRGFRQVLQPDDLYPLDEGLQSDAINRKFWQTWNSTSWQGNHKLEIVVIKTLKWPLLVPVIPRIILLALTLCQPLLVSKFLNFLQDDSQDNNIGYGLIGAYALVYFGMAISNGLYGHRLYRSLIVLRGVLMSAVYKRSLDVSLVTANDKASLTLMSTDVERIIRGLREVHEIWANFFQIGVGIYLLEKEVSYACIAPIICVVATLGFMVMQSKKMRDTNVVWIKEIQKRIGITSSALGAMKGVKMLGLTEELKKLIHGLRVSEIKAARAVRHIAVQTSTLAYVPQLISPVGTFAIFTIIATRDHTALDATKMFTSLTLLTLLSQPLFFTFQAILEFASVLGCFERLEKFLLAESRLDHRLVVGQTTSSRAGSITPVATASASDIELTDIQPVDPPVERHELSSNEAIAIRDGTFSWKKDGEPVLRDISLSIRRSQLTMIIGAVASGKTTLLKALLGEVSNSKGFVYVSDMKVAFCDQTPWLINESVQRNIIGFDHIDQERYDSVIYACDLERDIEILPNGHETLIGSKGIVLSGGQKQRVALARALYARNEIAIFDDIFSGLDKNTSKNVFDRVFGPRGLIRAWGTTVVLATHHVSFLPSSDWIIALGENGTIAEQGSFGELDSKAGYVHSFMLEHIGDEEEDDSESDLKTKQQSPKKQAAVATQALNNKKRQVGDTATYKYYFKHTGLRLSILYLLLQVCWAFFFTFPTVWLELWSKVNVNGQHQSGLYLGVYAVLQVLGLFAAASVSYTSLNVIAARTGIKLHGVVLNTVISARLSLFTKTDVGSLTNRFSQDIGLIDTQLPLAAMVVIHTLFLCVGQFILIASASGYIAISYPFLFLVFYLVQKYYLRTSRQLRLLDIEEKAPVYTQFIETLSGLATIRAFGWQSQSNDQSQVRINQCLRPAYLQFMSQRWLALVLDLINTALAVVVVGVAVKLRDSVSVGFTGVSLTQVVSLTSYLKLMILFFTQLENCMGAVTRIKDFEKDTESEMPMDQQEVEAVPQQWPHTGAIEIKDLCASYEPAAETKTLDNINISIKPGLRYAICGRTGSGKSSLLLSILNLLPPSSGSIHIDGIDITHVLPPLLRSRLNIIPQEPFFLHGTVRFNLDPNNLCQEDEPLISALKRVGLWNIISDLPSGLDTDFSEDMLSHGQRQLFCLARAIVRKADATHGVLLLDEVTSSVDVDTQADMVKILDEEFKGWTTLAIAHRLETVLDYDQVVVLDTGKVVEIGAPRELLAETSSTQKSWFREMWEKDHPMAQRA